MDSRKVLFAILAGSALTTAVGVLLTPYKDASKRKKIVDKGNDPAEELIKDPITSGKDQLQKMDEDADRMVNEGGKIV